MKPWIKAGLVGAGIEILLTLPAFLIYISPNATVSILTCCVSIAYLLFLPFVGVLTGIWLEKPVTVQNVLVQSSLAGLTASTLDGIFTVAGAAIISASGLITRYFERTMPEALDIVNTNEALRFYFSLPGQVISTSLCSAGMIVIGVALSMIGGLGYAAIQQMKSGQNT